jgi:hypothetical protein
LACKCRRRDTTDARTQRTKIDKWSSGDDGAVRIVLRQALALDWLAQTHATLGHHDQARTAWREALGLYREQGRDTDADRVRRQLDGLGHHEVGQPPEAARSVE